jgi:hypothetical protein
MVARHVWAPYLGEMRDVPLFHDSPVPNNGGSTSEGEMQWRAGLAVRVLWWWI